MKKTVAKVWTFKSSSGKNTYETLLYVDGSTSCNCPGWTRRVSADGTRTCKHIRYIDQGIDENVKEYVSSHSYVDKPETKVEKKVKSFSGKSEITSPYKRKIKWK